MLEVYLHVHKSVSKLLRRVQRLFSGVESVINVDYLVTNYCCARVATGN